MIQYIQLFVCFCPFKDYVALDTSQDVDEVSWICRTLNARSVRVLYRTIVHVCTCGDTGPKVILRFHSKDPQISFQSSNICRRKSHNLFSASSRKEQSYSFSFVLCILPNADSCKRYYRFLILKYDVAKIRTFYTFSLKIVENINSWCQILPRCHRQHKNV